MACVLTTGFVLDCRRSIGGVNEVYFTELSNKSTLTEASGSVSAITLTGATKFYKYELWKNGSEAKAENQGDIASGSGFLKHSVSIQLDRFEVAKRNEIRLLAQKPLMCIVKDANGIFSLYGAYRGLDLETGVGQTGKAAADMNGFTLTFSGDELDYPLTMTQAQVTAVI